MSRIAAGVGGAVLAGAIARGAAPSPEVIAEVARSEELRLGATGAARVADRLREDLLGLGPLEEFARIPGVTDVLVNGDGSVWVDRGNGVERATRSLDPATVRPLAVRLAGVAGRRLDEAQPWVDGLLPGRVRLHALLPPLAVGGVCLSLRVPRVAPAGLADLVGCGLLAPALAPTVREVLDARLSFLVVGGTGAGKTTLLAGLLSACARQERIVIIEDVLELAPGHPHVLSLQCRAANIEGAGAVSMTDLVRQALRMRPDRLVVGEVRGPELRDLLQALNTGHEGGAGTLHANSVADVPARCEALGALAGLDRAAVHAQLRGAVSVVFGVAQRGAVRSVTEVGVVDAVDGEVVVRRALAIKDGVVVAGPGADLLDELLRGGAAGDLPLAESSGPP